MIHGVTVIQIILSCSGRIIQVTDKQQRFFGGEGHLVKLFCLPCVSAASVARMTTALRGLRMWGTGEGGFGKYKIDSSRFGRGNGQRYS